MDGFYGSPYLGPASTPSPSAPQKIKDCVQYSWSPAGGNGWVLGEMWFLNSVFSGSGSVANTLISAIVVNDNLLSITGYDHFNQSTLNYFDSYAATDPSGANVIAGTSNLVTFDGGTPSDNMGVIKASRSKALAHPIHINTTSLPLGLSYVFLKNQLSVQNPNNLQTLTGNQGYSGMDFTKIQQINPLFKVDNTCPANTKCPDPSPVPQITINAGDTVQIRARFENDGPIDTANNPIAYTTNWIEVQPTTNSSYVNSPAATSSTGTNVAGSYGVACHTDQVNGSNSPFCNTSIWSWGYPNPIPCCGGGKSNTFSFKVDPSAPNGTIMCFDIAASPTGTGWVKGTTYCITINNPIIRYPYLTGAYGDIHAGGGFGNCATLAQPGTGKIAGQSKDAGASTKVDYIASANDVISNIAAINFGQNGSYGTVCRPDLAGVAQTLTNTPYSAAALNTAATGAAARQTQTLLSSPSSASICPAGPITGQVTVYVTGDATITCDINYDTTSQNISANRKLLPAFGIIATGNVYINPSVQHLDGYYYARDGVIDTCKGNTIPNCTNPLKVYGLMMANNFRLARSGSGQGLQQAEDLRFLGDLFLAPPPGFANTASPTFLGERPPLY